MTHYQISRNGQMYGPYTSEDLQRYLATGNVLPSDLAKSDEMTEWVPVSQLFSGQASASSVAGRSGSVSPAASTPFVDSGFTSPGYANPAYSDPTAGYDASAYPDAPNLNWGLVLLIDVFTCGLFQHVWNLIVASWLKKVQPNAISLFLYIAVLALLVIYFLASIPVTIAQVHAAMQNTHVTPKPSIVGGLIAIVLWIVRLVARFSQRASLEQHFNTVENVGLRLNWVLTFFFGGLYFQYHLNKINAYKQAARVNRTTAY